MANFWIPTSWKVQDKLDWAEGELTKAKTVPETEWLTPQAEWDSYIKQGGKLSLTDWTKAGKPKPGTLGEKNVIGMLPSPWTISPVVEQHPDIGKGVIAPIAGAMLRAKAEGKSPFEIASEPAREMITGDFPKRPPTQEEMAQGNYMYQPTWADIQAYQNWQPPSAKLPGSENPVLGALSGLIMAQPGEQGGTELSPKSGLELLPWLAMPGGFRGSGQATKAVAQKAATQTKPVLRELATSEVGSVGKRVPKKGTIVPQEVTASPFRMKITTTRGGSPFTEEITVTPVGDNLVGRAPNPYANSERLYAVYDKKGQVIKSGFDKHSEALDYAKKPVSTIAETTPKIETPTQKIEQPSIPVEPVQKAPTRATEPLIGGEGIKPPKPPVDIAKNPDDFISDFAKYVNGEESAMDWAAIQPIRSAERAAKASDFLQEVESGVKQGLSPDEILRNAERRLAGKLSSADTGIYVPPDKRQPFYAKLIDTVMNDTSIPRSEKAFKIQSTRDALDGFLDGRAIPNIPGIKEGSAKTRLQYLFKDNPDMLKAIDKPVGEPVPLDPAILEYLRGLSTDGGQLGLLPVSTRIKVVNFIQNKIGANAVDVLNIPRAVRASLDISFGGRQGLIAGTRHPGEWGKQFVRGLKALRSEELAKKTDNEILRDPDLIFGLGQLKLLKNKHLDIISLKKTAGYMERPEPFASRIADNIGIPKTGLKVRSFNRAFSVSNNSMLVGIFAKGVRVLRKRGADPEEYGQLADFANKLVGRGALPSGLQQAAPYLNALMFSPKYTFARISLPKMLLSSSPYVRKQAWQTLATFLGFGATILTAGYLLTKKGTEYDPRSTEFGKFTIGNTRFDMWSGYVQWVRFLAQITTGQIKTSEGKIVNKSRYDIAVRFAQSKDSPLMQILVDVLKGSDYAGEKLSDKDAYDYAKDYLLPFAVSDTLEALEQENLPTAVGVGAAAAGGIGVVTYDSKEQGAEAAEQEYVPPYRRSTTPAIKSTAEDKVNNGYIPPYRR